MADTPLALGSLLALLQFADGLFPAGGFAHSFGLETYVQDGRVSDRVSLDAWLATYLEASAGPTDAVAVAVAARHGIKGEVAAIAALDARLDATKWVPETRAAGRQMGRQVLRTAAALDNDAVLAALWNSVESGLTPGQHAVVLGTVLGREGIPPLLAAAAFLYTTAAMVVGAALRLLPLGQVDGQRVLAAARTRIAALASTAASRESEDMWSFTPALEIAGVRHADLDMRLFRS